MPNSNSSSVVSKTMLFSFRRMNSAKNFSALTESSGIVQSRKKQRTFLILCKSFLLYLSSEISNSANRLSASFITVGILYFEFFHRFFFGQPIIPSRSPVRVFQQSRSIHLVFPQKAAAFGSPFEEVLFHNINSEIPFGLFGINKF